MSPSANFFYYPLRPSTRDDVQFIDLTADGDGSDWRFGDGSGATDPWPTHRFEREGDYDVELTVRTGTGVVCVTRTVRIAASD